MAWEWHWNPDGLNGPGSPLPRRAAAFHDPRHMCRSAPCALNACVAVPGRTRARFLSGMDGRAIGMPSGTWDVISVTGAPTHAPTVAPTTVEPTAQPQAVRDRTLWPSLRPIRSARNGRARSRGGNVRQVTPAPSYFRHAVNWTQPWWNRTESIAGKSEQQVCRASACHVLAAPGKRVNGKARPSAPPLASSAASQLPPSRAAWETVDMGLQPTWPARPGRRAVPREHRLPQREHGAQRAAPIRLVVANPASPA